MYAAVLPFHVLWRWACMKRNGHTCILIVLKVQLLVECTSPERGEKPIRVAVGVCYGCESTHGVRTPCLTYEMLIAFTSFQYDRIPFYTQVVGPASRLHGPSNRHFPPTVPPLNQPHARRNRRHDADAWRLVQ